MTSKLYVGNIDFNTTEATLRAAFAADGRTVKEVAMPTEHDTGRPRGFAFVTMGSEGDAMAAVSALNGKELDGRSLRVNEARERTPGDGSWRDRS